MPNKPGAEQESVDEKIFQRILGISGQSTAYITLIIGYLLTILTTTQLTPLPFALFTFLNLLYGIIFWWQSQHNIADSTFNAPARWKIIISLFLCVVITEVIGVLPLMGLQWDWSLFLVTLTILFLQLPLRLAIVSGILLFVTTVLDLALLNSWDWEKTTQSTISLLPAFAFVSVFSLIIRVLDFQKAHAERLLAQLAASNAKLEEAHQQLQTYANQVEELTVGRERTRIAREIHDSLGHYLSILNIQLETISKLQEHDPTRLAAEIAEARKVAAQSMQEARNAVAALRPSSITTLNLSEALTRLGTEFQRNAQATELTLDLETSIPQLTPAIQVAFYRVAQEALTNIRKHTQASKVLLRLRYEDERLEMLIRDNGQALLTSETKKKEGGFGLIGLSERVKLLGGDVEYGPTDEGGYRVIVHVPVTQLAPVS
jgi:signal transduction histidine kinase